jgi:acetyl-CoA carboxylase carboxyltransferase component
MKLAAELVVDAVVPGDRLRGEIALRLSRAERKRSGRPPKKHLVAPV